EHHREGPQYIVLDNFLDLNTRKTSSTNFNLLMKHEFSRFKVTLVLNIRNLFDTDPAFADPLINERLTYMGWDGYELDYHTLSLAENCFESEGLKREGYASSKWFNNTFMPLEEDHIPVNSA
ncbi:MAG: hypothetical protein V3S89_14230, partial [Desulfobacterales bacterium]